MAFGQTPQPVDFNYFLARKYALLAQQADAGTTNAASGAIQANSGALAAKAAANLDNTQASVLPATSAAQIGLTRAQTGLVGQQAAVIAPESAARIGQLTAETALTGTQNKIAIREGLVPRYPTAATPGPALSGVLGAGGYQGFQLKTDTLPRRRVNESEVAYLDRVNGL